ncbi:3-hydroxyacyl-CoA dehydrogenase NAD-binding domain-containing protein, partial [Gilvimarinus sp. 1_MG-2023]
AIAGERDYLANRHRKQEALENNAETAAAMANLQQTLGKKLDPRYPAAPAILSTITAAMTEDFYKAQAMEAQIFGELASGVEAKNLVGLFLNDQYLKRETKRWAKQAHPVGKAAVLGAGIMGGGIGYQAALNGTPMLMKDINQEALDLGI